MVKMDLAYETAAFSLVVGRVFDFGAFTFPPLEQVLDAQLNLAAVADDVEAKVCVVQIALNAHPAAHALFDRDYATGAAARRTRHLAVR